MDKPIDTGIDWDQFGRARSELGGGFVRILGYFREDGGTSIAAIEKSVRAGLAAPLVLPAHKLKNEAREFGALSLAMLCEHIEMTARNCVDWRTEPTELVEHVVRLRPLFEASLAELDEASNPLMQRRANGSKAAGLQA